MDALAELWIVVQLQREGAGSIGQDDVTVGHELPATPPALGPTATAGHAAANRDNLNFGSALVAAGKVAVLDPTSFPGPVAAAALPHCLVQRGLPHAQVVHALGNGFGQDVVRLGVGLVSVSVQAEL